MLILLDDIRIRSARTIERVLRAVRSLKYAERPLRLGRLKLKLSCFRYLLSTAFSFFGFCFVFFFVGISLSFVILIAASRIVCGTEEGSDERLSMGEIC